jgi:hypothetical protein
MPATYVTEAELRTVLGIGSLYTSAVVEEVCQSAENIIKGHLWFNNYYAAARSLTDNFATLYFQQPHGMYVGQSVTITNAGSPFNGTKTLTAVSPYSITYAVTGSPAATDQHSVSPLGQVAGTTNVDYTTDTAVQNASLMIAVEIWQARTATLSGSNAVDFQPSPYRMSAQLLAKVRGLIAHALDPRSMVG